jgi:hypothetical protein
MKQEFEVVFERKEVLRNVIRVKANSKEEAEEIAEKQNEEYDWSESEIAHADESIVSTRVISEEAV